MNSSSIPKSGEHSMSKSKKQTTYKARLSYRKQWEVKYSWVYCTDVTQGMFLCFDNCKGNPPATTRGA